MWDPYLVKDVELLESVQKFALKVCCKQWSSPYEDLLEISRLSSLQARRETARLVYMYKLVHKLVDFQEAPIQYRPPLPYGTMQAQKLVRSESISVSHLKVLELILPKDIIQLESPHNRHCYHHIYYVI